MFDFFCTLIIIMFIIAAIKWIFSSDKKHRRKKGNNKYINNYERKQKEGKRVGDHIKHRGRNIKNTNNYENYNGYEEYEDYREYEKYEKEKPNDKFTKYPYRFKNLLTNTEYTFYKVLKNSCDANNLLICPKVRLEDFVEVTDYQEKYKFRAYIRSRHIDFIICDSSLRVLAGVELDDSSHNSQKAKENDMFKDNVFRVIGIPLFRAKTGNRNYQQQVDYIMNHIMLF